MTEQLGGLVSLLSCWEDWEDCLLGIPLWEHWSSSVEESSRAAASLTCGNKPEDEAAASLGLGDMSFTLSELLTLHAAIFNFLALS